MRCLRSLDMLLAAYAGAMLPWMWLMSRWLYVELGGGVEGFAELFARNAFTAILGLLLLLWSSFHLVLPVPALLTAIGIRLRAPWGRELGLALGGVMLVLFPIGTIIGMILLTVLLDDEVTRWFAGPELTSEASG